MVLRHLPKQPSPHAIIEFFLMKLFLRYILISALLIPVAAKAQFETFKDSVVQLYGVVMTADSLQALGSVSIAVKGQNRGTISNSQGVFSIVVLKGDVIFATTRPAQQRLCLIDDEYSDEIVSTGYCVLRANNEEVLPKWIFFHITSAKFKNYVEEITQICG